MPNEPNRHSSLRDILEFDEALASEISLRENLGDSTLCAKNRVYEGLRRAALEAGFKFSQRDPGVYFGWSLVSLDTVLSARTIPYRNNRGGLEHLEGLRPGFFTLADLDLNRPSPNYVLHETAHAVAYSEIFGRPRHVRRSMMPPAPLVRLILGEAYAMASEYFAACYLSSALDKWFFSISSYRRRLDGKKAIGEALTDRGSRGAGLIVLLAFLFGNYLRESITAAELDRGLELFGEASLTNQQRKRIVPAANRFMRMDPEFLRDTSKLFLGPLGYQKDTSELLLARDPLSELSRDKTSLQATLRLIRYWQLDGPTYTEALNSDQSVAPTRVP